MELVSKEFGPPGVDLRHTLLNRAAEITATEMDVLHRGSNILVAAKLAIRKSSQPERARSVRQRCLFVWVENRLTPARAATRWTTFDHVQIETGDARLRFDWERKSGPGSRLNSRRWCRYATERVLACGP